MCVQPPGHASSTSCARITMPAPCPLGSTLSCDFSRRLANWPVLRGPGVQLTILTCYANRKLSTFHFPHSTFRIPLCRYGSRPSGHKYFSGLKRIDCLPLLFYRCDMRKCTTDYWGFVIARIFLKYVPIYVA